MLWQILLLHDIDIRVLTCQHPSQSGIGAFWMIRSCHKPHLQKYFSGFDPRILASMMSPLLPLAALRVFFSRDKFMAGVDNNNRSSCKMMD
jgi:hypothetical protein